MFADISLSYICDTFRIRSGKTGGNVGRLSQPMPLCERGWLGSQSVEIFSFFDQSELKMLDISCR